MISTRLTYFPKLWNSSYALPSIVLRLFEAHLVMFFGNSRIVSSGRDTVNKPLVLCKLGCLLLSRLKHTCFHVVSFTLTLMKDRLVVVSKFLFILARPFSYLLLSLSIISFRSISASL